MSDINIFEVAARRKLRFVSAVGDLTVEQLFDLPLIGKGRAPVVDLDSVARTVNNSLKAITEESFVDVRPDPRRGDLEVKLEIVKAVIAHKKAEQDKAERRVLNAEKRRKLLEALSVKEGEALTAKTREELEKELADISD